jgi:DNA-binding transcriptional MerR regulator
MNDPPRAPSIRNVTVTVTSDDDELTIDELARRIGMTVRNIRAHQSRGLLPPPEVRGRTGYYGADHVARLELIQELQAEGFNL